VLQVFMRLEQRIAHGQLHQDAAAAPHVTRVAPAQPQDDLHSRCTTHVQCDAAGKDSVIWSLGTRERPDA
jgi:hypothetical protein